MKYEYNSPELKERRKELRNNATPTEKLLWEKLRKSNLGAKFVRQYGVSGYILDFYCPKKRLAIELDGNQHEALENKLNDEARTKLLESQNIRVLRFRNEEVFRDINNVCNRIIEEINRNP